MHKQNDASGRNNYGVVLHRSGDLEGALTEFRAAVQLQPGAALHLFNLGALLVETDQAEEALPILEAALSLDGCNPEGLNNHGSALLALRRSADAETSLILAVRLAPEMVAARLNLGEALLDQERLSEAIEQYAAATALDPLNSQAHCKLGRALWKAGRDGEGLRYLEVARNLDPSSAFHHALLGRLQQEMGDLAGARTSFRAAIQNEPETYAHHLNLAHITNIPEDDHTFRALRDAALTLNGLPNDNAANGHFALARMYSGQGHDDLSFHHQIAANRFQRRLIDYDESRIFTSLERIRNLFSIAYLEAWPKPEVEVATTPIFIVGMPRSGSTLVEQVLAGCAGVYCAGETTLLRDTIKAAAAAGEWPNLSPGTVPSIKQIHDVVSTYSVQTASTSKASAPVCAVTDKLLDNFRRIGIIHALFPNARIIHTFRNPIDVCLSCFSINFSHQRFAFDLRELGRYYRAYAMMMQHWRTVLPDGAFMDVRYEALVQDFERSARAIVAFCGLEWSDRCLRFHESTRSVRTASLEQVRRPLYTTSIRRWRPSQEALRPLLNGLGWPEDEWERRLQC